MSEPWDTCGKWSATTDHDSDCAWFLAANTPEAKAALMARINMVLPCAEHRNCGVCQRNLYLCSAHQHPALNTEEPK